MQASGLHDTTQQMVGREFTFSSRSLSFDGQMADLISAGLGPREHAPGHRHLDLLQRLAKNRACQAPLPNAATAITQTGAGDGSDCPVGPAAAAAGPTDGSRAALFVGGPG